MKIKPSILLSSLLVLALITLDRSPASSAVQTIQTLQIERVSIASDGTQGNDDSGVYWAYISANGRYVGFGSLASNLIPGDTNNAIDIFVFDRLTRQIERVSIASDGTQANNFSSDLALSGDGRYVAFDSPASNLVPNDTNGKRDIFVHDRQTNQTTRVSVASDGTQHNGVIWTLVSSISGDGRYVVFTSDATNLVANDTNGADDVFLHDMQTGQTRRISIASYGTQANGSSYLGRTTTDGRYIVFTSEASNLVAGDTNGTSDIFVHDIQTRQTSRVSVASNGTQANGNSIFSWISADGGYAVFTSYASNLVPGDTNAQPDVFLHTLQTRETTRVSVASDGGQANGASGTDGCGGGSSISADGRYVIFVSSAANLILGDTNGVNDVFVRDTQLGQTERISVTSNRGQGNGSSGRCRPPTMSADGSLAAFVSEATNLVSNDTNAAMDVFVAQTSFAPRLNLPFPHKTTDTGLNLINSFFDHEYPIYASESTAVAGTIFRYDGVRRTGTIDECDFGDTCYSGHNGYDFAKAEGTPVLAAHNGFASGAQWPCPGGSEPINVVTITQGWYRTAYLHLRGDSFWQSLVNQPRTVQAGDVIGTVGHSGAPACSFGGHLHLTVYYKVDSNSIFREIDPYGWSSEQPDPWAVYPGGAPSKWIWDFSPPDESYALPSMTTSLSNGDAYINVPTGAVDKQALLSLAISPDPRGASIAKPARGHPVMVTSATSTVPTGDTLHLTAIYTDGTPLTAFTLPVTLTVSYTDSQLTYIDEATLGLYQWDEPSAGWMSLVTSLNSSDRQASASASSPGFFSLRAQPLNPAPAILAVFPPSSSNTVETLVVVTGTNFLPTPRLNLGLTTLAVNYVSSSTLTATIPSSIPFGTHTLTLSNPDGQTTAFPNAFTVLQAVHLPIILKLEAVFSLRPGQNITGTMSTPK